MRWRRRACRLARPSARVCRVLPGRVLLDGAAAFLAARHSTGVEDLELLSGGFWSEAFDYRADGRNLVVRFGDDR